MSVPHDASRILIENKELKDENIRLKRKNRDLLSGDYIDIKNFLVLAGFKIKKYEKGYGVAEARMDSITWNENGNYIQIMKDAKTRTVFNGQIKSIEQLDIVMGMVR